jgi:sugar lactone lactonase YvrE
MYFTDSRAKTIYVYDFDLENGAVANRQIFARIPEGENGEPDGCAVDSEGFIWSAIYGAGKIIRYDPLGRADQEIRLPVSNPTSCCFGGPALSTLYITSARGKSDEGAPDGGLFAVETDVTGLKIASFAG